MSRLFRMAASRPFGLNGGADLALLQHRDLAPHRADAAQSGRLYAPFQVRIEGRGDGRDLHVHLRRPRRYAARIASRFDLADEQSLPVAAGGSKLCFSQEVVRRGERIVAQEGAADQTGGAV